MRLTGELGGTAFFFFSGWRTVDPKAQMQMMVGTEPESEDRLGRLGAFPLLSWKSLENDYIV